MAMLRSTYGSSQRDRRHPVSTDCGLLHPTIYSFLLSDCLYYWSTHLPCRRRSHMERLTSRCHLSTISAHLQKTTKITSVSTFISWP